MATSRSPKPKTEGVEPETLIVDAAEPLATPFAELGKAVTSGRPVEGAAPTPFAGLGRAASTERPVEGAARTPFAGLGRAASTGRPVEGAAPTPFAALREAPPLGRLVEGHELALGQMRLAIEEGLLMVFGPEGDPVPPQAFAVAAAAQPATLLELPDGTTASALRIAAVLRAQVLGRLGKTSQADGWILAMLREAGGPEPAAEDDLRAEQDASGDVDVIAAAPLPESDDERAELQLALDFEKRDPDLAVPVARGLPDGRADHGGWFSSLRNLSALTIPRGAGPGSRKGAGARGSSGPVRRAARARDKLERSPAQESGAGAGKSVASLPGSRTVALGLNPQALEADGFHALVVRDVPPRARLSAGAYDPALDGWVMRLRDLNSLMISAPVELRGDFTLTLMGIALRPGDANAVRILAWLPVRFA
jgi:hypothetical protein